MLDRRIEKRVKLVTQRRQVDPAGLHDPFAIAVVRERVQQVLDGEIGVAPRRGFAIGNRKGGLEGCAEHQASSTTARRG
jgi:hypothetical protein